MAVSLFESTRRKIRLASGFEGMISSLPALAEGGAPGVTKLPVCLRIMLESLVRNSGRGSVREEDVRALASWAPKGRRRTEIPFHVGRIVLQDIAGIPLLGDLAAMRDAVSEGAGDPSVVAPSLPVSMVIDHTLAVDYHRRPDAIDLNMRLEMERNRERFGLVKWVMQAIPSLRVIPPGFGILHQINLEHLSPGLLSGDGFFYPDTLVGTDSHTCMIAGLGVVGWGVGGIEAESAMLGEPVTILEPDVVGVYVKGALRPGVTTTDLVLHTTALLRRAKVVGKFLEFFGPGLTRLSVPDRSTIANMAPEYGATISYFPVDGQSLRYYRQTGRSEAQVEALEAYFRAQNLFGASETSAVEYSDVIELSLDAIRPAVAGPKRPQDIVDLGALPTKFADTVSAPRTTGGFGAEPVTGGGRLGHGAVVIAAITSCTNTSNPSVMLAAGLLARNAVCRGLSVKPHVKTSLAPGSRVVADYLSKTGLREALEQLGFGNVGFGCATCIGNSGPLEPEVEAEIRERDLVACAVLSGNRNFESRIHPLVRAAFLASPPLVVAFALAGRVDLNLVEEPLGTGSDGKPVYLADIWPSSDEVEALVASAIDPVDFQAAYQTDFSEANPLWSEIPAPSGKLFPWASDSTFLRRPPFFSNPALAETSLRPLRGARALMVLGDSITTDHISPVGTITAGSPAGRYLAEQGEKPGRFATFGERRMNHDVMVRGAFSNPRLRNLLVHDEGGVTVHQPSGQAMSVFHAAERYAQDSVPLVVIAGEEYGTGSARDWAAKATRLLGVRAVVAKSFERIHRSNLVGMGVLPCQLPRDVDVASLRLNGTETFSIEGLDGDVRPGQPLRLIIRRSGGSTDEVPLVLRADGERELEYLRNGGILPTLLRNALSRKRTRSDDSAVAVG